MSNYTVGNINTVGACWCACHQPWFGTVPPTCHCRCNAKLTVGFIHPIDEPVLKSEWQLMQERVNQLEAENKKLKQEIESAHAINIALINRNKVLGEEHHELLVENDKLKREIKFQEAALKGYQEDKGVIKADLSRLLGCEMKMSAIYSAIEKLKEKSRDKKSQDECCEVSGVKLDAKPMTANLFVNGQPVGKLINCCITIKE